MNSRIDFLEYVALSLGISSKRACLGMFWGRKVLAGLRRFRGLGVRLARLCLSSNWGFWDTLSNGDLALLEKTLLLGSSVSNPPTPITGAQTLRLPHWQELRDRFAGKA